MEERKKTELIHYDESAKKWQKQNKYKKTKTDIDNYNISIFSSYNFCKTWFKKTSNQI